MSAGSHENVMGNINNTIGSSEITSVVSDFYTNTIWEKYYDKYAKQTSDTVYNNRILGDATGEMGPFYSFIDQDGSSRPKTSWYVDVGRFPYSSYPWFTRGGLYLNGTIAGIFAFYRNNGANHNSTSFRLVLTPQ